MIDWIQTVDPEGSKTLQWGIQKWFPDKPFMITEENGSTRAQQTEEFNPEAK